MAAERFRQFASAAAAAAVSIARPNYFENGKRGEIFELRAELNSDGALERKEAVKKVIAAMTIGKDVSVLFPDVLKNVQTDDLELKKLVYLYLMNYATSQPELVILAINTLSKDVEDRNPLVRALALRTMGCLRVDKVLDYLIEPLVRCLRDESAYVRKTAVICAAKVVTLSPEMAEEHGLIAILCGMLSSDGSAAVLSNVVAALVDVQSYHGGAFRIDAHTYKRLLGAFAECTEWGQICILDALAHYTPEAPLDVREALDVVVPRLQHANANVVLSSIKVILVYIEVLRAGRRYGGATKYCERADGDDGEGEEDGGEEDDDEKLCKGLLKKMAAPLVSLLSTPPEIQYVVLKNITIILQRHPAILSQAVRVFFCKYNDPLYVKMEKVRIIVLLADDENYEQILGELLDYSREVDTFFVREAVRAIALCALNRRIFVGRAYDILQEMAVGASPVLCEAAIVAIQMLLQHYPEEGRQAVRQCLLGAISQGPHYGSASMHAQLASPPPQRSSILDAFTDSTGGEEARIALAWIIGEYGCDYGEVTTAFFEGILPTFGIEQRALQDAILSAALRLFCTYPTAHHSSLLARLIESGIRECNDNVILRERCITYRRLLAFSTNKEAIGALAAATAKAAITGGALDDGAAAAAQRRALSEAALALLPHLATLASISQRVPPRMGTPLDALSIGGGSSSCYDEGDNEHDEGGGSASQARMRSPAAPAPLPDLLDLSSSDGDDAGGRPARTTSPHHQASLPRAPIVDLLAD